MSITELLEQKKQEIQGLKESLARSEIYLEMLKDVHDPKRRAAIQRKKSNIERAAEIIKGAGRPLHANEILRQMGKKKTLRNKVSIASSMAHYSKKGRMFKRVRPNTFDLIH